MIELKPFERSDFNTLIRWLPSEEFMIQACGRTFQFPLTNEQLEHYIRGAEEVPAERMIFKAVDTANNKHIGNITLERIDRKNLSASVACVLIGDDAYKGKGICKIMMQKIISTAFDKLGLNKLTLNVYDFNLTAIKCYQSTGFNETGRMNVKFGEREYVNIKMELEKNSILPGDGDSSFPL
jgi:RimJ/RimL family protein N-acetyltransferase